MTYRRALLLSGLAIVLSTAVAMSLVFRIGRAASQKPAVSSVRRIPLRTEVPGTAGAGSLLDSDVDARYQDALREYEKKNYASAAATLYSVSMRDPAAPGPHFYLAICYLMTGDVRLASRELRFVTNLDDSPFLEPAHYYLAKVYLYSGDNSNGRRELDLVLAAGGKMKTQAQNLKLAFPAK